MERVADLPHVVQQPASSASTEQPTGCLVVGTVDAYVTRGKRCTRAEIDPAALGNHVLVEPSLVTCRRRRTRYEIANVVARSFRFVRTLVLRLLPLDQSERNGRAQSDAAAVTKSGVEGGDPSTCPRRRKQSEFVAALPRHLAFATPAEKEGED